ncbi:uridine diphosphate-N-acetylglucosamine-binding protein YvcK [Grimontia sp. NTOU-MAR1]|uniref:uridine diphosphate-N-acetylglucosamine-binding protein YvcK n=1 Tax=Grimontia sp. NTOU-MAR1 TaxID=3111011 RepID=UPI002DBBBE43|nr:uridine diphosphate-N-acetylglucosamine-binding protein YvcK [Grimontia sp. NTOU-MAR1]WRV98936.1 uridine diphosphate-N-acetylglucosamine-binding protein YvcK [Grimontia sp. NTOU-MAR1]
MKEPKQNIVAIGGGHGLGRVLSALREHGELVTGVVTTTDNGGSTGRIRACQGGIAWGDTRNCINQLITEPSIGSMIFEYRFKGNGELDGHNLGNLMLTALDNLSIRPLEAINLIRDMLKVSPHIVPMSEHPADLAAQTPTGEVIAGETDVDELPEPPARLMLEPVVPATKEAVIAIQQASLVVLGPGSFLTSVMPPLLLPEISRALKQTEAKIIFIRNLGKEHGPAGQMSLKTMLTWCERSMGGRKIDMVLGPDIDEELDDDYRQVVTDLASVNHEWRHDRDKLSQAIQQILLTC